MQPPRIFPSFNKVLYPYSPFLPPIDTQSLWRLMHLINTEGYTPSIAIAHEVRQIIDDHSDFLNAENEWISEKFDIREEETNLYIFGLFIPPTLLLASDMVGWIANGKIAEILTPSDDEGMFDEVRKYITRHMEQGSRLIDPESLEPMISADPIYAHCDFEVFSDNFWYLTGMQASKYLYSSLARLFDDPLSNLPGGMP